MKNIIKYTLAGLLIAAPLHGMDMDKAGFFTSFGNSITSCAKQGLNYCAGAWNALPTKAKGGILLAGGALAAYGIYKGIQAIRTAATPKLQALDAGTGHDQGRRPQDEDAFETKLKSPSYPQDAFGVYDGHGGQEMADHAQELLLTTIGENLAYPKTLDPDGSIIVYARNMLQLKREWTAEEKTPLEAFEEKVTQMTSEEKAILFAFLKVDKIAQDQWSTTNPDAFAETPGTTVIATVIKNGILYAGLLADARAVLADTEGTILWRTYDQSVKDDAGNMAKDALTIEEKAKIKKAITTERLRVIAAGGKITSDQRVKGRGSSLAICRAMGDYESRNAIISIPDMYKFTLPAEAKYLILACDGVWDVLSSEEAADFVVTYLKTPGTKAEDAAKALVARAIGQGSKDNVTATVVVLGYK